MYSFFSDSYKISLLLHSLQKTANTEEINEQIPQNHLIYSQEVTVDTVNDSFNVAASMEVDVQEEVNILHDELLTVILFFQGKYFKRRLYHLGLFSFL